MSLFTKPIKDITYVDVVSFCEQEIRESVHLEYKQDFPESEKLAKTISAFANTFGGLIIIGVAEEDSKPKPPFVGIDYQEKLEERITSMILSNIYPPIFPEIQVCPPKDKKTFIVIRASESNETPHAIYNNTKAYLRTGNINKPEELATFEEIEWLRNRRKKSEDFRLYLYGRAEERYKNICMSKKGMAKFGEFALSICPLYPDKPLTSVENIEEIFTKITRNSYRSKFPKFQTEGSFSPIQDGICYFFLDETTGYYCYSEISRFGLIFYKEDAGAYDKESKIKKIYANRIIRILSLSLESAYAFFEQVGYLGLLQVKFSLDNLIDVRLIPITREHFPNLIISLPDENNIRENYSDNRLSWEFTINATYLADVVFRKRKVIELGKDINWSFGYKLKEVTLEALVKKWDELLIQE